jgi:hypothetical protein
MSVLVGYKDNLSVRDDNNIERIVVDSLGTLYQNGGKINASGGEIDRACRLLTRNVNVTTSTLTVSTSSHDSKTVSLNRASGIAVTLPAATGSGTRLKFIILTTITSNTTTIKVTGNDVMIGNAIICNDTDNSVSGFETEADSDTITFNGSTTGGIRGDIVELEDIATDTWFVKVVGSATGSEATPFSATVT